jgi:hypothetical protein
LNMKYLCKGIKPLFMVVYLMKLDTLFISNNYETKRGWIVKIYIYIYIYKSNKDKCIPIGIKNDNVPPKFVVPIENGTLKDHNSYKSGLENIKL